MYQCCCAMQSFLTDYAALNVCGGCRSCYSFQVCKMCRACRCVAVYWLRSYRLSRDLFCSLMCTIHFWICSCSTHFFSVVTVFCILCFRVLCFRHTAYMLHHCNAAGWTWWHWSLILRTLSSFNALTLLVGSFDTWKPVPCMTCNVSGGTLNLTQHNPLLDSRHLLHLLPSCRVDYAGCLSVCGDSEQLPVCLCVC